MTLYANALLVFVVALERVVELVVSKRHERRLREMGGVEVGRGHYPPMVVLHTFLLAGTLLEPIVFARPFLPVLGLTMLAVVVLMQSLRWWSIASLGVRWCTRVIVVPSEQRIVRGPYRLFPHPNYVAVIAEGIALPLFHGAFLTALTFTICNIVLLTVRIRTEDQALEAAELAR